MYIQCLFLKANWSRFVYLAAVPGCVRKYFQSLYSFVSFVSVPASFLFFCLVFNSLSPLPYSVRQAWEKFTVSSCSSQTGEISFIFSYLRVLDACPLLIYTHIQYDFCWLLCAVTCRHSLGLLTSW